jgi:hypothetical protein
MRSPHAEDRHAELVATLAARNMNGCATCRLELSTTTLAHCGIRIAAQYHVRESSPASLYIAVVSLNWSQLRTWDGSQNKAFEELCCQLAHAEDVPTGSVFRRKGAPDAGVECFWTMPSGDETGWQTKFFSSLGDTQWGQIDKSVKTALDKHSRLTRYVVCLPFDRADPRIVKKGKPQKSAMSEWNEHVQTWSTWAAERGMTVTFDYWGDHEIAERLALEVHHGRHYFWFHEEHFGPAWFQQRFEEARANVGERYTPELNVDLPVARLFEGLGRTQTFRLWFLTLRGKMGKESQWLSDVQVEKDPALYRPIAEAARELIDRLHVFDDDDYLEPYGFDAIAKRASEAADAAYNCGYALNEKAREQKDREQKDREAFSDERRHSFDLGSLLRNLAEEASATAANAANTHVALLDGEAGQGKSHLLCDVAERRIAAKRPTVLLLGEQFTKADPWTQVLQLLQVDCKRDEFLGALDAAAEARRSRALILIDALNEGEDRTIWKRNLAGFLIACSRYPRISVGLSVRTSYVADVFPDSLGEKVARETHPGFAEHEYQAARTFFDWFGIKRPSVPLLNPEFQNPLFLKLFCKGVKDAGLMEMPKGVQGVTQMFDFLLDAVNRKLSGPDQLDFDPKKRLVHDALRSVAERLAAAEEHFLSREDAAAAVDAHLPNRTYNNSLFSRMLSEGLLTEERIYTVNGIREGVRFAYERLQDGQIASYLLDTHVGADGIAAALEPGKPLGARVREYRREWTYGLIEALSIQVPERFGVELVDVMPDAADRLRRSLIRSFLWRRPETIGDPKKYLRDITNDEFDLFLEVMLTVAANPDHPFNADFLHTCLMRETMPERDAWWSIYLAQRFGEHTAVDRLLEWAWSPEDKSHIDDESIRLTATALLWFLTTSHRPLRDRATKALVRLLTPRLHLLDPLLSTYKEVDDLYVRERLYGVAYGCVLRSADAQAIAGIARHVYEDVFESGIPTPHFLLRDYARGVIERAAALGVAQGVDITRARPPYKSDWPEDLPSIAELKAKYGAQPEGAGDEWYAQKTIYFSVAGGGDFDRYVIGTNSHSFNWTANRLGEEPPLTKRERHEAFVATLTARQQEALERLEEAYRSRVFLIIRPPNDDEESAETTDAADATPHRGIGPRIITARSEDDERVVRMRAEAARDIDRAERAFRRTLGAAKAASFDTEALPYLNHRGKDEERLFDLGIAHRFVLNRVFELGWTVARFGSFDRNLGRYGNDGRAANKPERIGKKYQWLAWHEFLARVADNFQYEDKFNRDEIHVYDGPWQDFDRDLDPSLLIASTARDRSPSPSAWWSPGMPYEGWRSVGSDAAWVAEESDLPAIEPLIGVRGPDGRDFLVLETYREWTEPPPPGVERWDVEQREIWYMVKGYLVRREDADTLFAWATRQNFFGRWMPESHEMTRVYFGELFWAPAFHYHSTRHTGRPAWVGADDDDSPLPAPILVATDGYMCEQSTFDCSLDETVNIHLPSAELVDWMGLTWRGKDGYFVDNHGVEVAFDPSVFEAGPGAIVVDRTRFAAMLEKQGLAVMWTVLGEKRVLAPHGEHRTNPYIISGCYRLHDGRIEGVVRLLREGNGDGD